ncbi:MAG: cation:proton antiporter [Actinobacteria bacterium]|nr:cation:proton antiporter [Actinomycetota bacterium]
MLVSLSGHQLLVFWVQFASLVALGRVLGLALRKIGQPSVIGELAAGLILGPSVFGQLWPAGFHWFLPDDHMQGAAIVAVSWVGAALLLVVTGFETDLALIARFRRATSAVAVGSLVVPFIGGLAVGYLLPESFHADRSPKVVFVLFIATALSISSLPVVAKILGEMRLLRRNFGQINLAAGMVNDALGWLLLGIISGLAASGSISLSSVAKTVGGMAVFLLGAFFVGRPVVDALLRRTRRSGSGSDGGLMVSMLTMLAFCVFGQAMGIEAVLGAFVAGILLGQSRFQHEGVRERIEGLTMSLFAPLFFATAGLRVDLSLLRDPVVLGWALVVIAVASVAKFGGAYLGARFARLSSRESLALGAGLNARGAMEVIIATVGLGMGVLNDASYTIIVLMAMVTSMAAPPTLRLAVRDFTGSDEEKARLDQEEKLSTNLIVKNRRLLLPSRGLPNSIVAAQILHLAWPTDAPVTVLSVGSDPVDMQAVLNVFDGRDHEVRQVPDRDAVAAILDESKLGFGAIGLGVMDTPKPGQLLSAVADDVVARSRLPMVVVRRARHLETPLPGFFTRCVVPVSGSRSSRAAQEIAGNLSARLGTELLLTHVITRGDAGDADRPGVSMLVAAQTYVGELGATSRTMLRHGRSVTDELLGLVRSEEADLVVVGASPRSLEERVYLGHMIEELLARCDATIVVVTVPDSDVTGELPKVQGT